MGVRRKSTTILEAFALMSLLLVPFQAHATMTTSFSDTTSLSGSADDINDQDSSNDTITLPGFDATLGTLTSAEVSFSSDYDVKTSGNAIGTTEDEDVEFSGEANWNFTADMDPLSSVDTSFSDSTSIPLSCFSSSGFCSDAFDWDDSFGDTTGSITNPGDLLAFLTPFNISFILGTSVSISDCVGDDCTIKTSGEWDPIMATVTYTYEEATDVPLPSTLTLLSLGLAGLAFGLRRR